MILLFSCRVITTKNVASKTSLIKLTTIAQLRAQIFLLLWLTSLVYFVYYNCQLSSIFAQFLLSVLNRFVCFDALFVIFRGILIAKEMEEEIIEEDIDGCIHSIHVRNFFCHENLEINLNRNVNFIVGRNGSGKSAILTALVVGLGGRASATNRGSNLHCEYCKENKHIIVIFA